MIQYYLTGTEWNEEKAATLQEVVKMFKADGGNDPAFQKGAERKLAAWSELRAWAKGDELASRDKAWWRGRHARKETLNVEATLQVLTVSTRIDRFRSCSIGGLTIRSKRADGFRRSRNRRLWVLPPMLCKF